MGTSRVLLLEDKPMTEFLTDILRYTCKVITPDKDKNLSDIVSKNDIACVIMETHLLNELELSAFRKMIGKNVSFLGISDYETNKKNGFDEVISKPFDISYVKRCVRESIKRYKESISKEYASQASFS